MTFFFAYHEFERARVCVGRREKIVRFDDTSHLFVVYERTQIHISHNNEVALSESHFQLIVDILEEVFQSKVRVTKSQLCCETFNTA